MLCNGEHHSTCLSIHAAALFSFLPLFCCCCQRNEVPKRMLLYIPFPPSGREKERSLLLLLLKRPPLSSDAVSSPEILELVGTASSVDVSSYRWTTTQPAKFHTSTSYYMRRSSPFATRFNSWGEIPPQDVSTKTPSYSTYVGDNSTTWQLDYLFWLSVSCTKISYNQTSAKLPHPVIHQGHFDFSAAIAIKHTTPKSWIFGFIPRKPTQQSTFLLFPPTTSPNSPNPVLRVGAIWQWKHSFVFLSCKCYETQRERIQMSL